jgi:hypothetical protein
MKKLNIVLFFTLLLLSASCISTKSTIQNIDEKAIKPAVKERQFILSEYASDNKYGYNQDNPINLGFENEKISPKNIAYFFNALTGKNG